VIKWVLFGSLGSTSHFCLLSRLIGLHIIYVLVIGDSSWQLLSGHTERQTLDSHYVNGFLWTHIPIFT